MPLAFDLITPTVFGFDPFRQLGIDLADLLYPFKRRNVLWPSSAIRGKRWECSINDGETLCVPLGELGVVALRVLKGSLVLYTPPSWRAELERRIPPASRSGPTECLIEGAPAIAYVLILKPGESASVKLPVVGDLVIQIV